MKLLNVVQTWLENTLGPVANWIENNQLIKALTQGFMYTMPVTFGAAIIAVVINFPISSWTAFLQNCGAYDAGQSFLKLTLSALAVYVAGAIGYAYTSRDGKEGMIGAVFLLGAFLCLIPIEAAGEGGSISAINVSYLGSDGFFVAILVGLLVSWAYCKLTDLNLVLKMPDSVPPMVSVSLAPTFAAMIIFTTLFFVRFLLSLTPYGNLFALISHYVGIPVMAFGSSIYSIILIYMLMNLFWFFGVHPNAILSVYMPVLISVNLANQEAYTAGLALPFLTFTVISNVVQLGGAGNTLSLCFCTLFAKSEKYRTMRKLVIPANLFNINEPVIFGFPIVMNPLYLLPMLLTPLASGLVAILWTNIVPMHINPFVQLGATLPWVTPIFMSSFLTGGLALFALTMLCLSVQALIYLPFFLIDDRKAAALENQNEKDNAKLEKAEQEMKEAGV